jgi:hypothetical protein
MNPASVSIPKRSKSRRSNPNCRRGSAAMAICATSIASAYRLASMKLLRYCLERVYTELAPSLPLEDQPILIPVRKEVTCVVRWLEWL